MRIVQVKAKYAVCNKLLWVLCKPWQRAERAKVPEPDDVIDDVVAAVGRWRERAATAGVLVDHADVVASELGRTALAG